MTLNGTSNRISPATKTPLIDINEWKVIFSIFHRNFSKIVGQPYFKFGTSIRLKLFNLYNEALGPLIFKSFSLVFSSLLVNPNNFDIWKFTPYMVKALLHYDHFELNTHTDLEKSVCVWYSEPQNPSTNHSRRKAMALGCGIVLLSTAHGKATDGLLIRGLLEK